MAKIPAEKYGNWGNYAVKVLPGLLFCFAIGALARFLDQNVGLISPEGITLSDELSTWFFVACFVGIGAGIDVKSLGIKELVVLGIGFLMTIILGIYAYLYSVTILL